MRLAIISFIFYALIVLAEEPVKEVVPPNIPQNTEKTEAVAPMITNQDGYFYDPTGRRDPFKPYFSSIEPLPVIATEPDNSKTPDVINDNILLNFDLEKYKVVAILWQVKDPKVVIKDPDGKTHLMRKENKLGKNNGFIAEIREGEIVVVEPVTAESGVSSATTRILTLRK